MFTAVTLAVLASAPIVHGLVLKDGSVNLFSFQLIEVYLPQVGQTSCFGLEFMERLSM